VTSTPEATRLLLFTVVWTAVWIVPLPRLRGRAELVSGLIPFVAFGLRVFAGFFVGVPEDDPVRSFVRPLLDWVGDRAGTPPYAWVLDGTVALGLVWLAAAFEIPRTARIATAWVMPVVAALSLWSLSATGLPIERLLAKNVPAVVLASAVAASLGAGIRWTPSPIPGSLRRRAAGVAIIAVPAFVMVGMGALWLVSGLPPEHVSQAESIAALACGAGAGLAGWAWGGFARPRSRFLFAMAIGVAAGAVVSLAA
jgi:hypothetical protein